jgi:P4 family phage/plasmid primase-like protien
MTALRGQPGTWQYLAFWRGPENIHLRDTAFKLPANEREAAHLLWEEFPGMLHYLPDDGKLWRVWDGTCHAADREDAIGRLAVDLGDRMRILLGVIGQQAGNEVLAAYPDVPGLDEKAAKELAVKRAKAFAELMAPFAGAEKYAWALTATRGKNALTGMLGTVCGTSPDAFAVKNPWLINCRSGTIDTERLAAAWPGTSDEALAVLPHDPADMITVCAQARWAPEAKCPQFLRLVLRMCGGDEDVCWFVIRALGYSLLGRNPERRIFFLNGPSSSGKTVVLWIVSELLGSMAHESPADLICVTRHGRNARTENSVRGARFVTIAETGEHMVIDEGQVKRLTGERTISVNQHYAKEELRSVVTWVIWIGTNKMPALTNYDEGMQERVLVIPTGQAIPEHQRDKRLAEKILAEERDAIFTLLVRAAAQYHREGLAVPVAVEAETARYRLNQDTVASFVRETMLVYGERARMDRDPAQTVRIDQAQAWRMYLEWSRGDTHLKKGEFFNALGRQPGIRRDTNRGSAHWFYGVTWNPEIRVEHPELI